MGLVVQPPDRCLSCFIDCWWVPLSGFPTHWTLAFQQDCGEPVRMWIYTGVHGVPLNHLWSFLRTKALRSLLRTEFQCARKVGLWQDSGIDTFRSRKYLNIAWVETLESNSLVLQMKFWDKGPVKSRNNMPLAGTIMLSTVYAQWAPSSYHFLLLEFDH